MSDTPHRPKPPARLDELIETGNPLGTGAPTGAEQPTAASAQAPTAQERAAPGAGPAPVLNIPDFAIIKKIGEGGMGAVYLAEQQLLHRKVAIKTMRSDLAREPAIRERFLREARAAAAVESDHIVPVLHVGEADGTPFIVMPFLKGEGLDVCVKREPVAPPDLVLKVAFDVATGLGAAHDAGLVHRDIKPSNIWLEYDAVTKRLRRCKILDFGLARSLAADDAHLTASGAVLGTPAFMAPEQARGERVDHRADLFSLGVVLYRMATGQQPFTGPSTMSVLIALTTETPRPVRERAPHVSPALADLIDRLMRKNPAERPQSAAEVIELVRRAGGGGEGGCSYLAPAEHRDTVRNGLVDASLAETRTGTFGPAALAPAPETAAPTVRDRLTELAGTAALVPLVTAACSAVWFATAPSVSWTLVARAFLLATALAWAVALVSQVPVRPGWRRWVRYAYQFVVGVGVGGLALWCDGWSVPVTGFAAVFVGIQYVLYFGLAVCACRWWADSLGALFRDGWTSARPGGGWRLIFAPLMLIGLLVAWPRDFAPLELAAVILVAALTAQAVRPLTRSVATEQLRGANSEGAGNA